MTGMAVARLEVDDDPPGRVPRGAPRLGRPALAAPPCRRTAGPAADSVWGCQAGWRGRPEPEERACSGLTSELGPGGRGQPEQEAAMVSSGSDASRSGRRRPAAQRHLLPAADRELDRPLGNRPRPCRRPGQRLGHLGHVVGLAGQHRPSAALETTSGSVEDAASRSELGVEAGAAPRAGGGPPPAAPGRPPEQEVRGTSAGRA